MASDGHTFHAEVLTPEGPVFEGEVAQVSTRTTVGEVGVLASHAPMLARLVPSDLRLHLPDGEVRSYEAGDGYIQVFANRALVLVAGASPRGG